MHQPFANLFLQLAIAIHLLPYLLLPQESTAVPASPSAAPLTWTFSIPETPRTRTSSPTSPRSSRASSPPPERPRPPPPRRRPRSSSCANSGRRWRCARVGQRLVRGGRAPKQRGVRAARRAVRDDRPRGRGRLQGARKRALVAVRRAAPDFGAPNVSLAFWQYCRCLTFTYCTAL